MSQYRYFGSGMHASAEMKRQVARVRKSRPDLFVARETKVSSMDGEGRVSLEALRETRAVPMSGRARHALYTKRS